MLGKNFQSFLSLILFSFVSFLYQKYIFIILTWIKKLKHFPTVRKVNIKFKEYAEKLSNIACKFEKKK